MRILQVVPMFYPSVALGGPAAVVESHAAGLRARGHDVVVLTTDIDTVSPFRRLSSTPDRSDASVVRLAGTLSRVAPFGRLVGLSPFSFVDSPELEEWLDANGHAFDAVIVHFGRSVFPIRAARKAARLRMPVFLQTHGMLARRNVLHWAVDLLAVRAVLEHARAVLVLQDHEAGEIREITARCHVHRLPNGVEETGLPRWKGDRNGPVLFAARLHRRKRAGALVEALPLLARHGLCPSVRIVGPDDGDEDNVRMLVRKLGLEGQVELVGQLSTDQVHQEMAEAACFVLPSANEPFPRALLEALAVGCPSIVTESCHIVPLLRRAHAAVVSGESPEDLAAAVEEVLVDAGVGSSLSENGRLLVRRELNENVVAGRLEALLSKQHILPAPAGRHAAVEGIRR